MISLARDNSLPFIVAAAAGITRLGLGIISRISRRRRSERRQRRIQIDLNVGINRVDRT
jgi:hypothetical protein